MDDHKEQPSEEDIPSDFFDDFNKDEFIQGLSVIDSWDDNEKTSRNESGGSRSQVNAKDVKDLREIIESKEAPNEKENIRHSPDGKRSTSASRLDAYIQPGSRRDPHKTSEAIKKDKEIKVKEYLAKHLESNEDIKPPGTELDDFYENENRKSLEKKTKASKPEEKHSAKPSRVEWEPRYSPHRRSPRRIQHYDRSPRRMPIRNTSPFRRSPHRRSPRRSPFRRFSPRRTAWRYSPPRKFNKPRRSPYRSVRERSPARHYGSRRSRSRSIGRKDDFLYPKEHFNQTFEPKPTYESPLSTNAYVPHSQSYVPVNTEYPVCQPEYSYPQTQVYPGYIQNYDYASQPVAMNMIPVPEPVPAPNVTPSMCLNSGINLNAPPAMVPAPIQMNTSSVQMSNQPIQAPKPTADSVDPLAQLVADGKLSHEDYLKLAPNKGATPSDMQAKLSVLKRCNQAISELNKLALPTRLLINHSIIGVEQKSLAPKYCSPLKRQIAVEFNFTKVSLATTLDQNKQIVDNIMAAVGLDKLLERPKKKAQKNTKDAAVQTSKHVCEVCEIREATKCYGVSTSTEPEYFTSSVHTQVVEQDLISSKSMFNPTGSASNNPMSIAHLTPAQLVSQLAARAKTLKQSPDTSQQYGRHPSPGYDPRGQQGRNYHDNYSNYRY